MNMPVILNYSYTLGKAGGWALSGLFLTSTREAMLLLLLLLLSHFSHVRLCATP